MYTDPEILSIIKKADAGCPKSMFIMSDYFLNGIEVPKSKLKSLEYSILLVTQYPEEALDFLKGDNRGEVYDYGRYLARIGIVAFSLGKLDIAEKYTLRAKEYFLKNYLPGNANETMKELRIEARLAVIQEKRMLVNPVIWFDPS